MSSGGAQQQHQQQHQQQRLSEAERLVLRRALAIVDSSLGGGAAVHGTEASCSSGPASASPPSGGGGGGGVGGGDQPEATPRRSHGFEHAYGSAVSSLRDVRRGVRRDIAVREERSSLFGKKGQGGPTSWRHKFVCLSDTEAERVPTGRSERVILEEAGLWEKTICFPDLDCDQDSFRNLILAAYPKLSDGGGFELLRCRPNSRELVVIGPKIASSPRLLKRRVGNGKVYVRPIQRSLSLEEEEEDGAIEVTEKCLDCGKAFSVSSLREHMKVCPGGYSGSYRSRSGSPVCRRSRSGSPVCRRSRSGSPVCRRSRSGSPVCRRSRSGSPVCRRSRSGSRVGSHGSHGGGSANARAISPSLLGAQASPGSGMDGEESSSSEADNLLPVIQYSLSTSRGEPRQDASRRDDVNSTVEPSSLSEVLQHLQTTCGIRLPLTPADWATIPRTPILVRREEVLHDALHEARKRRFDPTKLLNVTFVDEGTVDNGGPSREFWRLFVKGAVDRYCMGSPGNCIFMKNTPALQNEDFRVLGKLVATSIVQGGSGFPVMMPAAYRYLSSSQLLNQTIEGEVPDPLMRNLLHELEQVDSDEDLRSIFDDPDYELLLLETGFRKPLSTLAVADKALIERTVKNHLMMRVKGELDQFLDGLTVCGVKDVVQRHPDLMAPLFLHTQVPLTREYFSNLFTVSFSSDQERVLDERETFIFFMDYIEDCEEGLVTTEEGRAVALSDLLVFFSGEKQEPPLGFSSQPALRFSDDNLAVASTCDFGLYVPSVHRDYQTFKNFMTLSLLGHNGFGRV